MGIFLPHNINYKDKPQQYGDFSFVQSSLFENADRIGIEPDKIELAMPMWNAGDQQDYSKNGLIGINNEVSYDKSSLKFSNQKYISYPGIDIFDEISLFFYITITSPDVTKKWWQLCQRRNAESSSQIPFEFRVCKSYNLELNCIHFAFRINNSWQLWDAIDLPYAQGDTISVSVTYKYNSGSSIKGFLNGGQISGSWKIGNGNYNISTNTQNITIGSVPFPGSGENSTGIIKTGLLFSKTISSDQIAFLSDNPYYLWQPRNKRTWFIPVDATGGNILFYTDFKNSTNISNININILRNLTQIINNSINIPNINTYILRKLITTINNLVEATNINISFKYLINFILNIQNNTSSNDIIQNILRQLPILISNTNNSFNINKEFIINLFSDIDNQSNIENINIILYQIKKLITNIINSIDTTNLNFNINHNLNSIIQNNILSSELQINIKRLLDLNIDNQILILVISAIITALIINPSDKLKLTLLQDLTNIDITQDLTNIDITQDLTNITLF